MKLCLFSPCYFTSGETADVTKDLSWNEVGVRISDYLLPRPESRRTGEWKLSKKGCFTTIRATTFHFSSFQLVCIQEIPLRLMGRSNCVPAERDRLIQHTVEPEIVCARQGSVRVERNIPDGQCCGKSIGPTRDFFYFCFDTFKCFRSSK